MIYFSIVAIITLIATGQETVMTRGGFTSEAACEAQVEIDELILKRWIEFQGVDMKTIELSFTCRPVSRGA